jgi:hypothetical protein
MGKYGNNRKSRQKRPNPHPGETVDALGYRRMTEGKRHARPEPLGNIIPQILARYGGGRRLSILRYRETVKTILADLFPQEERGSFYTEDSYRLVGLRSGVLEIHISDAPLLSEFAFYKGEILRRLRKAMPDEKIRDIRFTLINH